MSTFLKIFVLNRFYYFYLIFFYIVPSPINIQTGKREGSDSRWTILTLRRNYTQNPGPQMHMKGGYLLVLRKTEN